MLKKTLFCLIAAAAVSALAFTAADLQPGKTQRVVGGIYRIVAAEAASTNLTGTATLSRLIQIDTYTNATVVSGGQTNVYPVLKESSVVTQAIGTVQCAGGYGVLAVTNKFIAGGDQILCTGTATGGVVRLILEER